ncbi:hypothetical protein HGO97_000815 [Faecalicatena sp. AGMB00832]|uniref:TetR family transcriptional regulator n=1 Tax=Faecalicatena faecalis TaxID=2726362 RepID=A0ABS6CYG3_9FIRM|nr:hypothetical protein [Faecalicatena faecalis]
MCKSRNIKDAFYLFYASKEELFFDVIMRIQTRVVNLTKATLGETPTKESLCNTLKLIYREYIKIPFILEMNSPDFIAFMNRLPKEKKIEELAFHGDNDIRNIIKDSKLQYKINEDKGNSAFAILFMPNSNKEKLPYNHLEVIDFMIEVLIESVFE